MEAVECGAASLAMVLAYFGHFAPLSEIRQACGVSRDGSTAKNIVVAARRYGLTTRALRAEPADLERTTTPAILHWEMNHFVVLERWTPAFVHIVDPDGGYRKIAAEQFDKSFTGICLEFSPGESFQRRPRAAASRARYVALVRGAGRSLAMVLFASLVLNVLSIVVPLTTQVLIDHVLGRKRFDWLWIVGGSAAALVTYSALFSGFREWLVVRIRQHLDVAITSGFVAHLLDLPVPFFAQRTSADLMMRVQGNKTIRDALAGQSVALLAGGVTMLAYLGLMFVFDARLSAIVVGAALLYVVVYVFGRPLLVAGADDAQRKEVAANSSLLQILRGIATIKSAGVERSSHTRWLNAWIAALNASTRMALRQQTITNLLAWIQSAVPLVVLLVGGRRVLDGELTPGKLVAFQMLQAGFLGPLDQVMQTLLRLQVVPVLMNRMDDVLLSRTEPLGGLKSPRLTGMIELQDVSFRYGETSPHVLSEISMRIENGAKVALVGPSGSGKSTLARLLLGLYAPTSGRILLDGHNLAELDLPSVRRQYGVVLQETALFDGTIADNLRLFYPNLPMEHVVHAARVAQIHDDILSLPNGYETRISSTGGPLSGGQRQRLALARAIVHRPPIMILDEATSALDAVTEAAIERYLTTRACTRIVIAHRLSTVRDADIIFVLDGGRIVEHGKHDDLIAAAGVYAKLAAAAAQPPRPVEASTADRARITGAALLPFEAFLTWSDGEREDLAAHMVPVEVAPGTRIVEQDARATGLFLLQEGSVTVELSEPGLATWTVAELQPGALFGEIGLLDGSPSSASVVAKNDVKLLHLPYAKFQELSQRGDVLAVRAVLAVGTIVAERTGDAVRRHAEMASRSLPPVGSAGPSGQPASARSARASREMPLAETLLGAPLATTELDALARMGKRVRVAAGELIIAQGSLADEVYVLLGGHAAIRRDGLAAPIAVADPGALLAEASVFVGGVHEASTVAIDDCVLWAVRREPLLELLLSGQRVARKLLTPLSEALVRRFRLSNYRLREAVALADGEVDRAHAAREQALEAAREEREALLLPTRGDVPAVGARRIDEAPAACFTALLRSWGRPVSLASVLEAFVVDDAQGLDALPRVARSLGLTCRRLDLHFDDLRAISAPVLVPFADERMVVVEPRGRRGFRVMDPLAGIRVLSDTDLERDFRAVAFEVREETSPAELLSLPQRAGRFARGHVVDLLRLLVVTFALQAMALAMALATAVAIDRVFPFDDHPLLTAVVASSAALAVAIAVMQQLQSRAIEHLRASFDREMLDQLLSHVLRLPISFFDRFAPGDVLQRLRAFENVRLLFSTQGFAALLNVGLLFVGGVLMVAFDPTLAGLGVAVASVYAIAAWALFPPLRRAAADETRARGAQQGRLMEVLQGLVTLRMSGDRDAAHQRWLPAFLDELSATLRQDRLRAFARPTLEWVRTSALVASVCLGARAVIHGTLTLGALVAFLSVLAVFLGAVAGLMAQVLSTAPSVVDYGLVRSTFLEAREQTSSTLLAPGRLRGGIVVENVSFRYGGEGGALVLKDVSLAIAPGTKVALVGASGSGKSTLGKLLLGLYLPTSGRILFDGKDVTSLDLEALRRRMGVVLQEPFLLTGSIRENLSLGAEGVPFERIVDAAKRAAIHEDIEKMPMGYSTLVSEGGTTFSGGQRQRCVIARALVSTPAVLLLDEATSALDNVNQALVERHLGQSSATRVVIAHRLSTIMDSDLIVVLHRGRIVETGTHEQLSAARGAYYDLVRAQL